MSSVIDRFMKYISIDTQSDEETGTSPSTSKQFDLARVLADDLRSGSVCIDCILEMNQGNHFKEPDIRTAKGFAWLLNNEIVEVSRK